MNVMTSPVEIPHIFKVLPINPLDTLVEVNRATHTTLRGLLVGKTWVITLNPFPLTVKMLRFHSSNLLSPRPYQMHPLAHSHLSRHLIHQRQTYLPDISTLFRHGDNTGPDPERVQLQQ